MRILPLILALCVSTAALAHDLPLVPCVSAARWNQVRPDAQFRYPTITDLESMTRAGHPMRNAGDPGNWVHELTHQINSDIRGQASRLNGREYNGFYLLNQMAVTLPEPNITLAQVASMVPKNRRGGAFQLYLVQQRRYWNNQPLYVLDEATASGNALYFQVKNNMPDAHRLGLSREWSDYSLALLGAVERFDPTYSHLPQLRSFVRWHNLRLLHLSIDYQTIGT